MNAACWGIRNRFQGVKQVSVETLSAELSSSEVQPLLLDVREESEFEVSHLRNAVHVQPSANPAEVAQRILEQCSNNRDHPVVCYCSIGYRSSQFAERLTSEGLTNVRNLEGSIFKWANAGHELVKGGGEIAKEVHPYNSTWGKLLRREFRASISE
mmetsp:Transcript_32777/g.74889  ORF Transcript_32777/g.74889 Transcript_32777/m.74889 type:complete len:156 (-) Transcript_32777:471-938(-)